MEESTAISLGQPSPNPDSGDGAPTDKAETMETQNLSQATENEALSHPKLLPTEIQGVSTSTADSTSNGDLEVRNPSEMSSNGKAKQTITVISPSPVKDTQLDKKWVFPWDLCITWKGIEELLKQAHFHNPVAVSNIERGKFELKGPDDTIIIPQVWELLVQPGWEIILQFTFPIGGPDDYDYFHPSAPLPPPGMPRASGKTEDSGDSVEGELAYDSRIKYTISFQQVGDPFGGPVTFLGEQDYYDPPVFTKPAKRGNKIPVLQEKRIVCRSASWRYGGLATVLVENQPQPVALGPGDVFGKTTLSIHSQLLLNALRAVVKYSTVTTSNVPQPHYQPDVPGDEYSSTLKDVFNYPFTELYHHKDDLLEYRDKPNDTKARHTDEHNAECNRHIDILIEYLYSQVKIRLRDVELQYGKKVPTTTFGSLWLLLKPGTDVYVHEYGLLNAYVIESVTGGVAESGAARPYSVLVWNLNYNGEYITRTPKNIYVAVFDGEREIISLPLFPVRFHVDEDPSNPLKDQLIERGKKFFQFAKGPAFQEYTGVGLNPGSKKYERARVVIDYIRKRIVTGTARPDSFGFQPGIGFLNDPDLPPPPRRPLMGSRERRLGAGARIPRCTCDACEAAYLESVSYIQLTFANYDDINPRDEKHVPIDHQYFLCASHMYGFILIDRIYDLLDINNVTEPKINVNAIDRLVMKVEQNKSMIKAICETYTQGDDGHKPFFADNIRGKGEGQIILLHGPPGTGKTLTAESVAEYTKRPLLCITAADLGHEPEQLEQNLLTFFRDGNDWDAIVLLDEADVYLETRSNNDLKRNSVVSIFLRALDYFQGILFLTTNRVGSFDEAFMSRIHIHIGYDELDDKARSQIWATMFDKLQDYHEDYGREIRYEWNAKEYIQNSEEVRKLAWNGREIRNAFQTAVALAVHDANGSVPKIKETHLQQVVKMSTEFKNYIVSTHQIDLSENAYQMRLRNDKFYYSGDYQADRGQSRSMTRKK